ncbi:MAG: RecQ family zinc-binding domain-containing protein, partial [Chloroflexi bacterium]|nr:RecQ family zinc-binding domain-containing protein [Chloroflexota bacterium]
QQQEFESSLIAMVRGYAETQDCRREYLLNYFGELFTPPCNHCVNCTGGRVSARHERDAPYALNAHVQHREWGEGLVARVEGSRVIVLFKQVGYKSFRVNGSALPQLELLV